MPKSASGRPSRSASRKTTPFKNATSNTPSTNQAGTGTKPTEKPFSKGKPKVKDLDITHDPPWEEPPLAEPRASYKDYDVNAQPNVSTASMQPLGTLPVSKNLFKYQAGKQKGVGKITLNGNVKGVAHYNGARDTNGGRATETKANTATLMVEAPPLTPPLPTVELRKFTFPDAPEEFPSTKTEVGRQKLSAVVQAAVDRSAQVGMQVLGKAIQALYEDSMQNPELGELLDAVLAQKATPEQTVAFQAHIRTAREKLEKEVAKVATTTNSYQSRTTIITSRKKIISPEPARGRRGRRSSRRIQEHRETSPQPDSVAAVISCDDTPSLGWPGEPSSPIIAGILDHDRTEQPPKSSSDPITEDVDVRYEKVTNELRRRMPSEVLLGESGIRFTADGDGNLVDATVVGFGVSTRASARKEISASRKRARSPDQLSTPSPATAHNETPPRIFEPLEMCGPPRKKRQTRVKTSPMKPRSGPFVLAGNSTTEAPPRGTRNASECISENDDLCCVCNGPGRFLCCDRCPRSFHFTCINPPVDEDNIPENSWYCNKCSTQMNPPVKHPRGLFGSLLDDVERRNPLSFSLPNSIKNYFVGVESGPSGEYMPSEKQDNKPSRRGGFVEELDLYRTKDKNGQPIFCFKCGTSALCQKKIIACDFCSLYWHLDCVHPPLANPPSPTRKWMCPAHAEQGLLQPRRPRNAKVVDTYLRRGHKNNGYIEIENSESEDELQFTEHEQGGIIYRLPERGIKLDFIDKIKLQSEENGPKNPYDNSSDSSKRKKNSSCDDSRTAANEKRSAEIENTIPRPSVTVKSLDETEFARTLLLLNTEADGCLNPIQTVDELSSLINVLLAEAPTRAGELLPSKNPDANASCLTEPPPLSPAESTVSTVVEELQKKKLQFLLELCKRKLSTLDSPEILSS